jgi:benzodiazapine receptor
LLFVGTLLVNYFVGIDKNGQISDKFHLYVTPPGFFFAIWGVIYITVFIAIVYNLIKN